MSTKELRELYTSSMWACSSNYCFQTTSETEVLLVTQRKDAGTVEALFHALLLTVGGDIAAYPSMDKVTKKQHAV